MESLASIKHDSWLSWFLRGLTFLGFIFLFVRLVELQVVKGSYFRGLANENRVRKIPITAARGKILARGGEILVDNKEVKKAIKFDSLLGFTKTDDLKGVPQEEIVSEWQRIYPLGATLAHVSGYVGEISENEVGKVNPQCPEKGPMKAGNLVGRAGLEEEYDCVLSGTNGEELVEVDTRGRKVRTLGIKEAIAGKDIKTWIDFGLQKKVAEVMDGKKGAVVVTDASGQVLALYSSPSFDPNLLIQKENSSYVSRVLNDPNLPLFDRAVGGQFHPGSVFKPFLALAALSEGKITKNFLFDDPGVIKVGKFSYANWLFTQYGGTEGKINVVRALARSTDTFFYKIGEMVGIDKIDEWANIFGLGDETKIDIPGEVTGLVPTPEWKLKVIGEPWFLGNTYHMAIGQGDLSLTPIGLHRGILAIASEGRLCSLGIVKEPVCKKLRLNSDNLKIVKEGMEEACAPGGTGFTFFDFASLHSGQTVACKTGTAETNEDGKTHAWFTVFSPVDLPDIVLTVVVERGGEGSKVAGPIARDIFNYWFSERGSSI